MLCANCKVAVEAATAVPLVPFWANAELFCAEVHGQDDIDSPLDRIGLHMKTLRLPNKSPVGIPLGEGLWQRGRKREQRVDEVPEILFLAFKAVGRRRHRGAVKTCHKGPIEIFWTGPVLERSESRQVSGCYHNSA